MEKILNAIIKKLIKQGYVIEIEDSGVVQLLIMKDNVDDIKINIGVE